MGTVLQGTEELSLEIGGTIPEQAARAIVGPGLEPIAANGHVELSLLLFQMRGLHPIGVPLPIDGMDYREALYRIAIRVGGAPAWFAAVCDLDSPLVGAIGRVLVRYPVRNANVEVAADAHRASARVEVRGAALAFDAIVTPEFPPPLPPRRCVVRSEGALFEIPWEEVPGKERAVLRVNANDELTQTTLGTSVAWSGLGLALRGRTHKCGLAKRLAT